MFSSKYLFYVQKQQRKAACAPVPSTKAKAFEDCTQNYEDNQNNNLTTANVSSSEPQNLTAASTLVFTNNMTEKEVKRELFILECESEFDNIPHKTKMMMVIKKSDSKLKDWFYEKGTDGTLPDTWEDFKAQIVDLCMEQALESLQRYNNEPWSSYVSRLKDKALSSKIPEQEVFKKLRRERAPETFRQLFYSFGVTLDSVIERINEFETN
ncbi:hypothetical protein NGRA_3572, partial [Nosema granulosis]